MNFFREFNLEDGAQKHSCGESRWRNSSKLQRESQAWFIIAVVLWNEKWGNSTVLHFCLATWASFRSNKNCINSLFSPTSLVIRSNSHFQRQALQAMCCPHLFERNGGYQLTCQKEMHVCIQQFRNESLYSQYSASLPVEAAHKHKGGRQIGRFF